MRVILFIGHHKVGSSALQRHLAEAAPAALGRGMLYPVVTRRDLKALNGRVDKGHATQGLSRNVIEAHNALAFSMIKDLNGAPIPDFHDNLPSTDEMFAIIREQVNTYQPQVLVLAAEVFANFAAISPALIDKLYTGLGLGAGDTVEIFAYLRRIDDYLASWHGQRVRFGQKLRPLPGKAIARYQQGIHFDYRLMIEAWLTARPDTRAVIRPYDKTVRQLGSAMHFAKALGLELPDLDVAPDTVNQSIHRGVLELARQANGTLEPPQARRVFQSLLRVSPLLDIAPSHQIELYGTQARQSLYDSFVPIHDWLSAQIGETFFADLEMVRERLPVDEAYANLDALAQIERSLMHEFPKAGKGFISDVRIRRNFDPN